MPVAPGPPPMVGDASADASRTARALAFQSCPERLRISINPIDQAGAHTQCRLLGSRDGRFLLCSVIVVMQRLVHVADEVDDKVQRFCLGCSVSFGAFTSPRWSYRPVPVSDTD